jgi:hypothetical protein
MDNYLDYIAEAFIRGLRRTFLSWLGLGGTLVLSIITFLWYLVSLKPANEILVGILVILCVSILVFIISLLWELWAIFPNIKLIPIIEDDPQHELNHLTMRAFLTVEFNEPSSLTCHARLVEAYSLLNIAKDKLTKYPYKSSELRWWSQNKNDNNNCEKVIAPLDSTEKILVAVIQDKRSVSFGYCGELGKSDGGAELYVIKIRVDGQLRGRDISPRYFNGYLYIEHLEDMDENKKPQMFFKEGDWAKDKHISKRYLETKVSNEEQNSKNNFS